MVVSERRDDGLDEPVRLFHQGAQQCHGLDPLCRPQGQSAAAGERGVLLRPNEPVSRPRSLTGQVRRQGPPSDWIPLRAVWPAGDWQRVRDSELPPLRPTW